MRTFISYFLPSYPKALVYMLQGTEYHVASYLQWYWRTRDFTKVMTRRELKLTRPARLLLCALRVGMGVQIMLGACMVVFGAFAQTWWLITLGALVLISYPILWAHLVVVPLWLGRLLIVQPQERKAIEESEAIFAKHPGIKIAIAGSYGKTTMKELLLTVLSEGRKVAATPENKNVAISHARFAKTLQGDEEIIIIEYGEGAPGDVARFAATTHPSIGIITGLAPAHLDRYKTVQAAGEDIFSLAEYLQNKQVYVSGECAALQTFMKPEFSSYSASGVLGWTISESTLTIEGTSFTMKKGDESMELRSGLLGHHQVAVLGLVAALSRELGLTKEEVERGVSRTKPFEHRMQPRSIAGAWIIDDTYNGNIEGVRVGLELLAELPARRRLYITPGLVDQGAETERVHMQLGKLIASAGPDVVVLMSNSVTDFIQTGLREGGYHGRVLVETNPLAFYTDLTQTTAAGDLVLMQNDWTDNYF